MTDNEQRADMEQVVAGVRTYGKPRRGPSAQAAVIYARISTTEQESIGVQLEQCRKYAARLGLPIIAEYDDEQSGLITTRPGYRALLALAEGGRVSHVIVFHSSRWGRDAGEYLTAAGSLERLGVELHATSLGKIDPALAWVHAGVAHMEVRNISAHTLPTMLSRAAQGKVMGRPRFGYRRTLERGIHEPHPEHFGVMQDLFGRYAEGESLYGCTQWFNRATGLHKRPFSVRRLLEDAYYCGVYVYNRARNSKVDGVYQKPRSEWVTARHPYPAVDMATWTAVQARLTAHSHVGQERAEGPRYALTGLVWCADCAKRMHGQPDETGRYPFYHCPYCGRSKSCRKVEATVRAALELVPVGPRVAPAMRLLATATVRARQRERAATEEQIARLRARRVRLTTLYGDGEISPADYQAARLATETELAPLLALLDLDTGPAASDTLTTPLLAWLESLADWAGLDRAEASVSARHAVYSAALSRLTLHWQTGTLTVRWARGIASLMSEVEHTVPIAGYHRNTPPTARHEP